MGISLTTAVRYNPQTLGCRAFDNGRRGDRVVLS
ncbi:MAG: hypothetical protein QOF35_981, partial [Actinomycetota bacterium]|nr:hypothetical protein [Actinomycetota bacterium]